MTDWQEITEEAYDSMMGMVPPAVMFRHGFLFGEAYHHRMCCRTHEVMPTFQAFVTIHDRYYQGPAHTIPEFRHLDLKDIQTYAKPLK